MIAKEKLERLYLQDHLTYEEIGKVYSTTRQYIYKLMKRYGIDTSKGERFKVKCDRCGKEYEVTRKKFKQTSKHYCGKLCYFSDRYTGYTPDRYGQMVARRVMAKHLGRRLEILEVVHHIDGDCSNNEIDNLMVFSSNSEHIKYHHSLRINKNG